MQLNREELLKAYKVMNTIRNFEEKAIKEAEKGNIAGSVHLYAGEEASATAVMMQLSDKDYIASTHRGHGHCIAKGVDVIGMMKELFGRKDGICGGKGGSLHIADLDKGMLGANGIVGAGQPLVCGSALAQRNLKTGGVSIGFFGDGASNQGTTAESMSLAAVLKLPVIFLCEDNNYGEATHTSYHLTGELTKRAEGFGMPGKKVDGTDFFAVYQAAKDAIDHARSGKGPYYLHVKVNRFFGHYSGDAYTYVPDEEKARMRKEEDPIKIFKKKVLEAGLLEEVQLQEIENETDSLIERAIKEASDSPPPTEKDLETDVYYSF